MTKNDILLIKIEGAITFTESQKNGDIYTLSKMNPEYKVATVLNGYPYVSKDGARWVVAIAVMSAGEICTGKELVDTIGWIQENKGDPFVKTMLEYLQKE